MKILRIFVLIFLQTVPISLKQFIMHYSIKDLIHQWFSKSFIYDVLKQSLPFSKQFKKNRRFFNEDDIEILKYYKDNGLQKTVLRFWTSDRIGDKGNIVQTVWKSVQTVWENSPDSSDEKIEKAVKQEVQTVKKQFEDREVELEKMIEQKDQLIKIKDEQAQKYALLKQEEKKEKDEWIKKYDLSQNEKGEWMKRFYNVKMYMMVFLLLLILSVVFSVITFLTKWM